VPISRVFLGESLTGAKSKGGDFLSPVSGVSFDGHSQRREALSHQISGQGRDSMVFIRQSGQDSNLPLSDEKSCEREDEARKIRRLQVMISMVISVISQDPNLTVEEASELAAGAKRAALAMFPDKELAYDLIYKPRLQRVMKERFRLQ
jgi:hypothetical protein